MNISTKTIKQALLNGERVTLECKLAKAEVPKSVWETYSAFANTIGGLILLGVEEHKKEIDEVELTLPVKSETVNGTVNGTVNATVKLNKTQKKILAILHENKYATYEEIAKQLDMARATVGRNIDTMKKENVIRRVGGDKNGSWEVLQDDEQ